MGSWESSGVIVAREGGAAGAIGAWTGKGGEVDEDAVVIVCGGRGGTEGRSALVD